MSTFFSLTFKQTAHFSTNCFLMMMVFGHCVPHSSPTNNIPTISLYFIKINMLPLKSEKIPTTHDISTFSLVQNANELITIFSLMFLRRNKKMESYFWHLKVGLFGWNPFVCCFTSHSPLAVVFLWILMRNPCTQTICLIKSLQADYPSLFLLVRKEN